MPILKRLVHGLTAVLRRIGRIHAWLIFTLFYFVVFAPVAVLFRCLADPLRLRRGVQSVWAQRSMPSDRWVWAKSQ